MLLEAHTRVLIKDEELTYTFNMNIGKIGFRIVVILICCLSQAREDQGKRVTLHIGLIPRAIPLKLFSDMVRSSSMDIDVTRAFHSILFYVLFTN